MAKEDDSLCLGVMQGVMEYILAGLESSVFHNDPGALAFAGAENDGRLRAGGACGRAAAVRVVFKAEFAPAQFRS
jgi:hypothetical protein